MPKGGLPPGEVVYVGDSLTKDVYMAKRRRYAFGIISGNNDYSESSQDNELAAKIRREKLGQALSATT